MLGAVGELAQGNPAMAVTLWYSTRLDAKEPGRHEQSRLTKARKSKKLGRRGNVALL
jgi:hypothetical protein